MHPFDELVAYVRFTDADAALLRALWPHVAPRVKEVTGHFYDTILQFEGAARVFRDAAQVERLKQSLAVWLEQMCSGPYDLAYYELRQHIGRVHVRVGLASQYMFTAMNLLRQDLMEIARAQLPQDDVAPTHTAILRITDIELAIMLGTYMEAREQREMQDFGGLILSHLPITVVLVDENGCVTSATTTQTIVFDQPEVRGRPVARALRAEVATAAEVDVHLQRALTADAAVVLPRVEVELGETRRSFRVTFVPVRHPLARALIHIEDLTEALSFEARARKAEHLAKLGTLAATVAHEIRNPLAGISGVVQVISSSLADDDKRREALAKVQEQLVRLGSLVGDLLTFSRPITPQPREVDLLGVVQQASAQVEAGAGDATVEGTGVAHADPALLSQVVLNLIQNAWQAGARRVVVSLEDGRVRVLDDGPGIAADVRERLFEPFFTTKIRGTGLGLPVARKIVESMGGTLDVCPSPYGGAGFDVRLPAS